MLMACFPACFEHDSSDCVGCSRSSIAHNCLATTLRLLHIHSNCDMCRCGPYSCCRHARPSRIKTQTFLPSADTAAMLFWALLASGQINTRKVDGWQTLATKPIDQPIDLPG